MSRKNEPWLSIGNNIAYYEKFLMNKLMSSIVIDGLADVETLDREYFMQNEFERGHIVFCKDNEGNLRCLNAALIGLDCYNKPVEFETANPVLPAIKGKIGKDGVVVYNGWNEWIPAYNSVKEFIAKYAFQLAQIDQSININLYNSKLSIVFNVGNDKDAQRIRKMYDEVTKGSPAVMMLQGNGIMGTNSAEPVLDVKANYIIDKLLSDKRTIINEFENVIGIGNVQYEKKERLVSGEVNANEDDNYINSQIIIGAWNKGFDKVNKMFGTNLHARLNEDMSKEDDTDEELSDEQTRSDKDSQA